MTRTIPFNKPHRAGNQARYVAAALESGKTSGDGPFTKRCEALLEQLLGAPRVLLTTSCTSALEMAALLLELGEGDEVILPSFTFPSSGNAFALRGCKLVFADCHPQTLNIDPAHVAGLVTNKTKVVLPVHYGGVACDMGALREICTPKGIAIIEDAAQAIFASYNDAPLGSLGDLGCISFHETKNIVSGEGGALVINNPKYLDRAEILREKGTNRKAFFRGEVDKYRWVDIGSSYVPSELCAGLLLAQLEDGRKITNMRLRIHQSYQKGLKKLAQDGKISLPQLPNYAAFNAHNFFVLVQPPYDRNDLIAFLKTKGVIATFHYMPLHSAPAMEGTPGASQNLPVTDRVSGQLVRLPLFSTMSEEDVNFVVDCTRQFFA